MRRLPNFNLLRAFEAAARLHSFTLAARELHVTASAISHQIRELEAYFGQQLFTRHHRRVDPTAVGDRLFASLGAVLDSLENVCDEVNLTEHDQVLALHCSPSLAAKWLGPRLPAFARLNPGISIRLSTGAAPVDLTRDRSFDVTIAYSRAVTLPGLEVTSLGEETYAPLCAPALFQQHVPVLEQLCSLTLIDTPLTPVSWRYWFELNGVSLPNKPRPSFDRAALAISAAVDGMGVALESMRFAQREIDRGDLVALSSVEVKSVNKETHYYTERSGEGKLPKIKAFRRWLFEQLREDEALSD